MIRLANMPTPHITRVAQSVLLTDEQKIIVSQKLINKINAAGMLLVKSQEQRTQLGNKKLVLKKINAFVTKALIIPKKRKPTSVTKAAKEKRLEQKKQQGETKFFRKKIDF